MKRQAQRRSGYFWELALCVMKKVVYHQHKIIFTTSQKYGVAHSAQRMARKSLSGFTGSWWETKHCLHLMNMLRLATDVRRQVKMVKAEKRSKSCGCVRASLEAAGMWHTLSATGTYTGTLSQSWQLLLCSSKAAWILYNRENRFGGFELRCF